MPQSILPATRLRPDCLAGATAIILFIAGLFTGAGRNQVRSAPVPENSPTPSATAAGGESGWPLFRGNTAATGVALGTLPEKLQPIWTFSIKNGGFESSAAIADGKVFIGSVNGKFYCIDFATGRQVWEFGTQLGFTASPAVRGGLVYAGDSDGRFHCLDAKTGKEKWFFDTEAEIDSSGNFHGDHVLVGSQDGNLYCLKGDSGGVVWKYKSENQIRCFPTVVDDRAFVAGCDGQLHVIELKTGTQVAEVPLDSPTGSTPAVIKNLLFVGTEGKDFLGIDWQQAKVLWKYEAAQRGAPFRSSAAVTPEILVVGSQDKLIHALHPKTGAVRWTFPTRGRVDGSPVIVGDRVFVGSGDGRLYAIQLKTGKELWRFEAGGAIAGSPAVANGRLVIGTDGGDLYCLGAK
ncbi:MAG: PQQ-binding-like beta-propeller repeat protein [Thermoguttaceae bacterium]